MVAEVNGAVVGTLQFHLLPSISGGGAPTAEVESVHVAESYRRQRCRQSAKTPRLQLQSRIDAHRFYERLGFVKSHEGMKRNF